MKEELKITRMGKLLIYMTAGEPVAAKSLLGKMFPKSKHIQIMQEAKTAGIMNAHVFHTHAAVQSGGKMAYHSVEGNISGLTVCIELIDKTSKLQDFFIAHKEMLEHNPVIFKEVEFWEYND